MYTITYQGAPYGLGETGYAVSRHRTLDRAFAKLDELSDQARYYRTLVVRDKDGKVVGRP